jgi:hypothetical protein
MYALHPHDLRVAHCRHADDRREAECIRRTGRAPAWPDVTTDIGVAASFLHRLAIRHHD